MFNLSEHHRRLPLNFLAKVFLDLVAFTAALLGSVIIRYPIDRFFAPMVQIVVFLPYYLLIRVSCFYIFKLYKFIWRYTGTHALFNLIKATSLGSILFILLLFFVNYRIASKSVLVVDWLLVIFFTGGLRLLVRKINSLGGKNGKSGKSQLRILIYGAGDAGELLLRNIESSHKFEVKVVGFIDDDKGKHRKYIHNIQVLGDRTDIGRIVKKYNIAEIYFSIPSLSGSETREILQHIKSQVDKDIVIKTIPDLSDLVSGRISINQLRSFEIKDLLRRKPVELDFKPVEKMIEGKVVLIVGGGGSIGLELCRQVARFNPAQLIVMDSCEFNCYKAEDVLSKEYPNLSIIPLVADAGNKIYTRKIFAFYRPDLVFHAAAYKHVPMMEMNPWAAIQNNIASTLVLTELSGDFRVEKFVMISTDKAVQPTSVMGATKRICELITILHSQTSRCKFMTVRFGNVLGSSGSVIHKFREQLKQGGPITITHPDITRYFMLISEAVELVLQAGAIGNNGNIYVLDMGEPIKIVDLAKYMIELSGLKVNEDIKLAFIGLRPGEKLHESLLLVGQEKETKVPNLFVFEPSLEINDNYFKKIDKLLLDLIELDHDTLRAKLKELVPEYQPNSFDFITFKASKSRDADYIHKVVEPRSN